MVSYTARLRPALEQARRACRTPLVLLVITTIVTVMHLLGTTAGRFSGPMTTYLLIP